MILSMGLSAITTVKHWGYTSIELFTSTLRSDLSQTTQKLSFPYLIAGLGEVATLLVELMQGLKS